MIHKHIPSGRIYGFWLSTLYKCIEWKPSEETGELIHYYSGNVATTEVAYPSKKELLEAIRRNKSSIEYFSHTVRVCRVK